MSLDGFMITLNFLSLAFYITFSSVIYSKFQNSFDSLIILLEDNLNLEVILFDERYSTYKTTEMLKEQMKLKSSQIKRIKDKLSAQYILQEYIDHKINR